MSRINLSFDPRMKGAWGALVPIDVYNEQVVRVADPILRLTDVHQPVELPGLGLFVVRAYLASGECLSSTVRVTEKIPDVSVRLTSDEQSPRESLAWAYQCQSVRYASGGSPRLADKESPLAPQRVRLLDFAFLAFHRMLTIEGRWSAPLVSLANMDVQISLDQSVADEDERLLAHVTLKREIPYGGDLRVAPLWEPTYMHLGPRDASLDRLFAIPPARDVKILLVRADTDELTNAAVRTLVWIDYPAADALLAYLSRGAVGAARRISSEVVEDAIDMLERKRENPTAAVIAGYFLLRAGHLERRGWMKNLADWFTMLPDGAVIYATSLLRVGTLDARLEAKHYLLEAVRRGIPVYTTGLRLLFDGLRSLTDDDRGEEELGEALRRVRVVAAYADWETPTTSFSIPSEHAHLFFG